MGLLDVSSLQRMLLLFELKHQLVGELAKNAQCN